MSYTRDEVLDKLIAAGLGDIEQHLITPDQFKRAMAGEVVIERRERGPGAIQARSGKCPQCGGQKENRSWGYCQKCNRERRSQRRPFYL